MFAAQMAALDEAVYDHLADDPAAVWASTAGPRTVRAILETEEPMVEHAGMDLVTRVQVVRLNAAEVERVAPGVSPVAGDTIAINGVAHVVRGLPRKDVDGRDWICPVS